MLRLVINLHTRLTDTVHGMLVREEGQTLTEYALILALIAVVVAVALVFLQGQISGLLSEVGSKL